MVWLKIRKHDINATGKSMKETVVVWLKIRKHDIASLPVLSMS